MERTYRTTLQRATLRPTGGRRTSTGCFRLEVSRMLGERLRYRKDKAACPQSGCTETRGERAVEVRKPVGCHRAAASREGLERCIEAGTQIKPTTEMSKMDDLDTYRKRCQQLRALQRFCRSRKHRQSAVHASRPIVGGPRDRTRRDAMQIAQGECQQPACPKGGGQWRHQAKRQDPGTRSH